MGVYKKPWPDCLLPLTWSCSSQHVPVTQLVLRMEESVTVTLISLRVSLLVSAGANCMLKESAAMSVKKASMV